MAFYDPGMTVEDYPTMQTVMLLLARTGVLSLFDEFTQNQTIRFAQEVKVCPRNQVALEHEPAVRSRHACDG